MALGQHPVPVLDPEPKLPDFLDPEIGQNWSSETLEVSFSSMKMKEILKKIISSFIKFCYKPMPCIIRNIRGVIDDSRSIIDDHK